MLTVKLNENERKSYLSLSEKKLFLEMLIKQLNCDDVQKILIAEEKRAEAN